MRPIDADNIIKWYSETHGASTQYLQRLVLLNEIIKCMPTVDTAIHAKWIEVKSSDFRDNESFYKCSICGRTERKKEPYCNCGAKMDKE